MTTNNASGGRDELLFADLQRINLLRARRWHKGGLEEWSVNDWLAAFGGEAGEALNAGKKHRRILSGLQQNGNVPSDLEDAENKIMEELADSVIYADLVASRLGRSLAMAVVRKFNAISEREGFPERLGFAAPAPAAAGEQQNTLTEGALLQQAIAMLSRANECCQMIQPPASDCYTNNLEAEIGAFLEQFVDKYVAGKRSLT